VHDHGAARRLAAGAQIVFQDPMSSLDPRMPVGDIIAEPMHANGFGRDRIHRRVPELLDQVGLEPRTPVATHTSSPADSASGWPSPARCSVEPELLVLDEPVSALDVSVQAGVLNLLTRCRPSCHWPTCSCRTTCRDRHVADRVTVVYLGRTVETGAVADLFDHPVHPYTRALLSAVPSRIRPRAQSGAHPAHRRPAQPHREAARL